MERMSTAEATVATLLAHGLDTVYALPGVHNDFLFDAFFKAGEKLRVVHSRHEQGAGYMALGAALATNKPHAYAVVPGPGLLNTSAALLTAYSMNAPVLALIGQIPEADIGRGIGHLHEIRDQAGILSRLVDFSARIRAPKDAPGLVAKAMQALFSGRPGPAALECAIDVWGREGAVPPIKARCAAAAAKDRRGRDPQGREDSRASRAAAHHRRRRRARRRRRGRRALRHAASAGQCLAARARGAFEPRSVERNPAPRS